MESQRVGHDWVTFTSLLSNFQVQGTIPSTIITLLWNRSQEFWFPQGIHPAVGFCWVIWQFYFQGVLCVCVCVNQKMIFFKKISREKHQIIVFFSGWKEEWIRKLTACFLKCFLTEHWGCKSEKKKSHWNMCDWLFFAWHLVVTWKNCSFDLWEGAPWETTGKRKGFGFVLCIHRNLNGSPRTDPGNLEGGLWTQSLPIIWFPVMLQERPKSRRQKNVFSYLLF